MTKQGRFWYAILILFIAHGVSGWHDAARADDLQLVPVTITDNGPLPSLVPYNDLPAFKMLVPYGWDYVGAVVWDLKTTQLATFGVRLTAPDGVTGIHVHPFVPYIWDPANGIGGASYLTGEGQYVSGYVVQRPLSAVDYLVQKVIGPKRPGAALVGSEPLPHLIEQRRAIQSGKPEFAGADAARVRVSYVENGVRVEEDFYTVIDYSRVQNREYFSPHFVHSIRAPQGRLDVQSGLLYTLVSSIGTDPVWYANYIALLRIALEARRDEIRLAGEIARMLINDANQIHEGIMNSYRSDEVVRERMHNAWVDTILGVENYRNPGSGEIKKLPAHYQNVWRAIDGNLLFTNDPLVDPNIGSNIDWVKLARVGF